MIKLRHEILNINDIFANHLVNVQIAKYKPLEELKEGDSIILEDGVVLLTKELAEKLNKEEKQLYEENKDDYEVDDLIKWIGRALLISSEKDLNAYLNDIRESFLKLSFIYGKLIVLGDWNTPWLYQKNAYPQAAESLEFFKKNIDTDFNGGFVLDNKEILEFLPHLFWLIRCNASLPEFMISFEKSKTIFGICKYCVLHLEFYDSEEKDDILSFFKKREFKEIDTCNDPIEIDNFDGRKIEV